uniref:Uncharacterized protein n=1 Tax=Romanomermis culicivorax TaxID=13658 RepID=A0A915JXY4_ROMCU
MINKARFILLLAEHARSWARRCSASTAEQAVRRACSASRYLLGEQHMLQNSSKYAFVVILNINIAPDVNLIFVRSAAATLNFDVILNVHIVDVTVSWRPARPGSARSNGRTTRAPRSSRRSRTTASCGSWAVAVTVTATTLRLGKNVAKDEYRVQRIYCMADIGAMQLIELEAEIDFDLADDSSPTSSGSSTALTA